MQQEAESGCTSNSSSAQMSSQSASDLLSSADSVLVHSGNVASWNKLRRKGVLTSTDEVRGYSVLITVS